MSQPDIEAKGSSGRHVVQYYDSPAFLAQSVAAYLGEGLRQGQAALVICTADHRELIEQCLDLDGLPVAEAPEATDVRFVDATDLLGQLMPDDHIDEPRFES